MKTLIIPDIHGRQDWKRILYKEDFDRVVFLGDYFDSFDIKTTDQINNFLDIIEYKKTSGKDVVMLIGNHDHHYIVGDNGTSGFQQLGSFQIMPVMEANKEHLQMAYQFDNFLCTHAGVGETFMDACFGKDGWKVDEIADKLNELQLYKPLSFVFNGSNGHGDDIGQTPIWIRPRSLMLDSKELKKKLIQIVGHTGVKNIDPGKATGGRYYFVDTLSSHDQEYLLIENNIVNIKK